MKVESQVIVDQHATVNLYLDLVHTARHMPEGSFVLSSIKGRFLSYFYKILIENVNSFVDAVQRARPSGAKGTFIKKVSISSTMGVGINVNI